MSPTYDRESSSMNSQQYDWLNKASIITPVDIPEQTEGIPHGPTPRGSKQSVASERARFSCLQEEIIPYKLSNFKKSALDIHTHIYTQTYTHEQS